MGEFADAIIAGEICQECMLPLEPSDTQIGPRSCAYCHRAEKREARVARFSRYKVKEPIPGPDQIACPTCKRVVKRVGLPDHFRSKHPNEELPADDRPA